MTLRNHFCYEIGKKKSSQQSSITHSVGKTGFAAGSLIHGVRMQTGTDFLEVNLAISNKTTYVFTFDSAISL